MSISLKADASGTFGTLQVGGVDKLVIGPNTVAPAAGVTMVGNGPAFSAYRGTVQSIVASNTFQDLIYDTELDDTNSAYNVATGVFTAPQSGYYVFSVGAGLAGSGISNSQLTLHKNGVYWRFIGVNGVGGWVGGEISLKLMAGDAIKVQGKITGTSLSMAADSALSYFSAVLMRSA